MTYQRIKNFPSDTNKLASMELFGLAKVWQDRRADLENTGVFQEFLRKMQKEWAIETGIIERLYSWDRGVTEILIEQGVDVSLMVHRGGLKREAAHQAKNLIDDQLNIVEGLFTFIKGEQPLTEHFIRGLHAEFTTHQEYTEALDSSGKITPIKLQRGEYKSLPNNPRRPDGQMHEYCPPEFVPDEMQNLIHWYREAEYQQIAPEILSAWLHHRFTQIHPFQDGNGRVARALATLVFLKAGLFPLVVRDSDRRDYIEALEVADAGNLKSLVNLFAKRQKASILSALDLETETRPKHAEQVISATFDLFQKQFSEKTLGIHNIDLHKRTKNLLNTGEERFLQVADFIDKNLNALGKKFDEFSSLSSLLKIAQHESSKVFYGESCKDFECYEALEITLSSFETASGLDKYCQFIMLQTPVEINTGDVFSKSYFQLFTVFYAHKGQADFLIKSFSVGAIYTEEYSLNRLINPQHDIESVRHYDELLEILSEQVDAGYAELETKYTAVSPAFTELFQFNYAEPFDSVQERFKAWLEECITLGLAEWQKRVAAQH